jgi:nucleoid-associated protein YgaU
MKRLLLLTAVLGLAVAGCEKPKGPQTTEVSVAAPPGPKDMLTPEPAEPAAGDITAAVEPEPEEEAALPPPPAPRTHTIRKGDTLWSLARVYLADPKRWKEIAEVNPGLVASALPIGKTITIPEQ